MRDPEQKFQVGDEVVVIRVGSSFFGVQGRVAQRLRGPSYRIQTEGGAELLCVKEDIEHVEKALALCRGSGQ